MKIVTTAHNTAAGWAAENPTLYLDWLYVETDTGAQKRGDGATKYNDKAYEFSPLKTVANTAEREAATLYPEGTTFKQEDTGSIWIRSDASDPTLDVPIDSAAASTSFLALPLTDGDQLQAIRPAVARIDTIEFTAAQIDGVDGDTDPSVLVIPGVRATITLTAGVDFDVDATIVEVVTAADTAAGVADAGVDIGYSSDGGEFLIITHEINVGVPALNAPTFTDTAVDNIDATQVQADAYSIGPLPSVVVKTGINSGLVNTSQSIANLVSDDTTTVLDISSKGVRATGSDPQTYTMPVAATVPFIGWGLPFYNDSTGIVTVQSSGANTIQEIEPGGNAFIMCIALTGTGATSWRVFYSAPRQSIQSSNFNAVVGGHYQVDTSGGAVTVTLPAAPSIGDVITVEDAALSWNTNAVTLDRNSLNINSAASNYTANVTGGKLSIVYISVGIGWSVK